MGPSITSEDDCKEVKSPSPSLGEEHPSTCIASPTAMEKQNSATIISWARQNTTPFSGCKQDEDNLVLEVDDSDDLGQKQGNTTSVVVKQEPVSSFDALNAALKRNQMEMQNYLTTQVVDSVATAPGGDHGDATAKGIKDVTTCDLHTKEDHNYAKVLKDDSTSPLSETVQGEVSEASILKNDENSSNTHILFDVLKIIEDITFTAVEQAESITQPIPLVQDAVTADISGTPFEFQTQEMQKEAITSPAHLVKGVATTDPGGDVDDSASKRINDVTKYAMSAKDDHNYSTVLKDKSASLFSETVQGDLSETAILKKDRNSSNTTHILCDVMKIIEDITFTAVEKVESTTQPIPLVQDAVTADIRGTQFEFNAQEMQSKATTSIPVVTDALTAPDRDMDDSTSQARLAQEMQIEATSSSTLVIKPAVTTAPCGDVDDCASQEMQNEATDFFSPTPVVKDGFAAPGEVLEDFTAQEM